MSVTVYSVGDDQPTVTPMYAYRPPQPGADEPPRPPWFQKEIMGWACPRCGRCYAPFVPQCTHCGPKSEKEDGKERPDSEE